VEFPKKYEDIEQLNDDELRSLTGTKHTTHDKLVALAKGKWRLLNEEDAIAPDAKPDEKPTPLAELIGSNPDAKAELQEMLDLAAARAQPEREANLPEMFERTPSGRIKVRNRFAKDLLPGTIPEIGERISDFFIDMRSKEIWPYDLEKALFMDLWAMFPCAANGGIYHFKSPLWTEVPLVKAGRRKVRKPQLLIRQVLENRHPTMNSKGYIICDRHGASVEFFAKELVLGLNWSAPKWEAMPYKFMG